MNTGGGGRAEGAVFKREWFRSYREAPASFTKIVQSWDTAAKTGEQNDFSVCSSWGVTATGYYLLALWRNRVEFPALRRQVALQAEAWKPSQILIEDTSAGQSLIQELKAATRFPVKAVKVDKDKRLRAETVTPLFEAGKVFFPESAPWLNDFMDELAAFPNGTHDDCVDSVTQALNYLRGKPDSSGFFKLIAAQCRNAGIPVDPMLLSDEEKVEIDGRKAREWEENRCRWEATQARAEDISVDPETGRRVYWNARVNEWIDFITGAMVPSVDADVEVEP